MRRTSLVLLVALAAIALPASASAYKLQSFDTWPKRTVGVWDDTRDGKWRSALKRAIKAWNKADVGVKLRRVTSAKKGAIVVSVGRGAAPAPCVGGFTELGSEVGVLGGQAGFANIAILPSRCGVRARAVLVAHELGHALGLDHSNGHCALMNRRILLSGGHAYPEKCGSRRARRVERTLVQPDDRKGARVQNHPPKALKNFKLEPLSDGKLRVSWDTPKDGTLHNVLVHTGLNFCLDPRVEPSETLVPRRGKRQSVDLDLQLAGRWCVTIQGVTRKGQLGTGLRRKHNVLPTGVMFVRVPEGYDPLDPPWAPVDMRLAFGDDNLPGQETLRADWDFGDPASGAANHTTTTDTSSAEHTYSSPGTYRPRVTIHDHDSGLTGTISTTIVIGAG